MLTGKELGDALAEAIKKKRVSKADVARHFGVKPPSVQDWLKHGRISKTHIERLVAYFSDVVGPEHWGIKSQSPISEHLATQFSPVPDDSGLWKILEIYRALPEHERQELIGAAERIMASYAVEVYKKTKGVDQQQKTG